MILKIKTKSPTLKKKKKNPPCNAEDSGLIPGQGTKISRAAGQLSPGAGESLLPKERSRRTVQTPHAAAKTRPSHRDK